jgi:4-hydroxyphenylpyruvate dioxygenase
MKRSQLAINSISTSGADLEERLAAYRAAGFGLVEFYLPHLKDWLAKGRAVADAKRLLDRHGLRCIGGFQTVVACFGDRAANGAIVENARLLGELGAGALVVGTDGPADLKAEKDPLGTIAAAFSELGREIRDTGVSLCLEFNWSPVVKSLRSAVEVAKRSGAANVGVLFDPAHYHCTPTKFEMIDAEAVRFIKHVHVDDMRDKPAELSHCNADRELPGKGHLDLKGLFGALERHGYRGFFSIEMFSEELRRLPCAEAARLMHASLLPLCAGS